MDTSNPVTLTNNIFYCNAPAMNDYLESLDRDQRDALRAEIHAVGMEEFSRRILLTLLEIDDSE